MKKNLLTIALAALGMLLSVTGCKKGKPSSSEPTPDVGEKPNTSETDGSSNTSKDSTETPSVPQDPEDVDVIAINTDSDSYTVKKDETKKITVQVQPVNATNKNVSFTSINTEIATVSGGGVITGNKAGNTSITITSISTPTVSKTVSVTVTEDSSQPEKTELDIAKENALAELNKPVEGLDDLEQANKDSITKAKQDAIAALDSATTVSDVNNIVSEYKNKVNAAIAKDKEDKSSIKALKDKKDSAKQAVNSIDATLYRSDEQSTLASLKQTALDAIEAADSIQQVDSVLTAFNTAVSNLKTDAQYKQEEKAALDKAIADAKGVVSNYKSASDYRQEEAERLAKLVSDTNKALDAVTKISDINDIVDSFKTAADGLMTRTQHEQEDRENLEVTKTKYKDQIDNYGNGVEYDTAEDGQLTTLKNNYKSQIAALTGADGEKTPYELYNEFYNAAQQIETKAVKLLRVAKENATGEIANVTASKSLYFSSDQAAIQDAIDTATAAVSAATTEDEVTTALNTLTTFMNGKTKKADALTSAKGVIDGYETTAIAGFEEENKQAATTAKNSANDLLDGEGINSQSDIDSAVELYKDEINDLKTKDAADKALKAYKSEQTTVVNNYKPEGFTEIDASSALSTAIDAISNATSTVQVDVAVNAYKAAIDTLISNKKLADERTAATNTKNDYLTSDQYNSLDAKYKTEVDSAKSTLQSAIDSTSATVDSIKDAVDAFKAEIDRIKVADAAYKALADARQTAKGNLDTVASTRNGYTTYVKNGDTVIDQTAVDEIDQAKATAITAIDNAESQQQIDDATSAFEDAVEAIILNRKNSALLGSKRTDAIDKITAYLENEVPSNHTTDRNNLISEYTGKINNATSEEEINGFVAEYKTELEETIYETLIFDSKDVYSQLTSSYNTSSKPLTYTTGTLSYIQGFKPTKPNENTIQLKKSLGVIYNTTPIDGTIKSVSITTKSSSETHYLNLLTSSSSTHYTTNSSNVAATSNSFTYVFTLNNNDKCNFFNFSNGAQTPYIEKIEVKYLDDDSGASAELNSTKQSAKDELDEYKKTEIDNLTDTYKAQVNAVKTAQKNLIDQATDAAGVTSALAAAKVAVDSKITEVELPSAKEKVLTDMATWLSNQTIPSQVQQTDLNSARTTLETDVNNAQSIQEVETAKATYQNAITALISAAGGQTTPTVSEHTLTIGSTEFSKLTATSGNQTITSNEITYKFGDTKKQASSNNYFAFLTKGKGFMYNDTAIPGIIKSIKVKTASGASSSAKYYCNFSVSKLDSYPTTKSAINISNGAEHIFTNDDTSSNIAYFNIGADSTANGQLAEIVITYLA